MKAALLACAVVAMAVGFGLRPALAQSPWMWASMIGAYLLLGALALRDLQRRDLLWVRLRPKGGDVSIGILIGLCLTAAGILAQRYVAPISSPRAAWLFQLYAQIGNVANSPALLCAVALLGILEEVVWRGWVLESAREQFGVRAAAPLSAAAYSLAHLPSAFTLASEPAGPNPLLVLASLGAGGCWAFLVLTLGRLWPVIISHLVFSYFLTSPLPSWL
jgi:membrane protease YdiL (CAAX protease family)